MLVDVLLRTKYPLFLAAEGLSGSGRDQDPLIDLVENFSGLLGLKYKEVTSLLPRAEKYRQTTHVT
jgi:hypothetical protein